MGTMVGPRSLSPDPTPAAALRSRYVHVQTAASIDWPKLRMTAGVTPITNSAHPACPMAKLTRSRRPVADARAARSTPFTAAELAAPKSVLRVDPLAGSGGEVVVAP